jgi:hypothetical protein
LVAYDYRGIGVRIEPMTLDDRLFDDAFDIYEQLLTIAGVDAVAVLADLHARPPEASVRDRC